MAILSYIGFQQIFWILNDLHAPSFPPLNNCINHLLYIFFQLFNIKLSITIVL